MSSNFGQIGPPTTELAALERLRNNPHRLIMSVLDAHGQLRSGVIMVFPLFLFFFFIGSF